MIDLQTKIFAELDEFLSTRISKLPQQVMERHCAIEYDSANFSNQIDNYITQQLEMTFSERLFQHIDELGYTDVEVYRNAHIDRRVFSKIRSNKDYRPSKITVIQLALALELSLDEVKELLQSAGFALSNSNVFDVILQYCFIHGHYEFYLVNAMLDQYQLEAIGVIK